MKSGATGLGGGRHLPRKRRAQRGSGCSRAALERGSPRDSPRAGRPGLESSPEPLPPLQQAWTPRSSLSRQPGVPATLGTVCKAQDTPSRIPVVPTPAYTSPGLTPQLQAPALQAPLHVQGEASAPENTTAGRAPRGRVTSPVLAPPLAFPGRPPTVHHWTEKGSLQHFRKGKGEAEMQRVPPTGENPTKHSPPPSP